MGSLEAGTFIWSCLCTSTPRFNSIQFEKYPPREKIWVRWKWAVNVDVGSFLDLERLWPAIWSLSKLWNPLKEKSIIFLIFKNSQHYLEFLIPGKGSLRGICHKRVEVPLFFLRGGQLPAPNPAAPPLSPPTPRSLVALPTQGLFVIKSFKMLSQSGENTCFWSTWWNTFPWRSNFSVFHFAHSPRYLSLPIILSPEYLKGFQRSDWLNGAFLHVTHAGFASLLFANSKEERSWLYWSQSR